MCDKINWQQIVEIMNSNYEKYPLQSLELESKPFMNKVCIS